jgi:hypothetical protein
MAYGFIPVGGIDGRPYNGATMRCVVVGGDTTDIYPGDFVIQNGTSVDGCISVTKAVGSGGTPGVIWGAMVSIEPNAASGDRTYVLGSVTTDQYINVAVATTGMLFMCNPASAIAATDVGGLADFTMVAGDAPYYKSKSVMAASFGTSTAQLQFVGQVRNGKAITAADADLLVRVTESQVDVSAASVGV